MPEKEEEEDFKCGTCALSVFQRRKVLDKEEEEVLEEWDERQPDRIPRVGWREGKGVMGGWECVVNGDCSFLTNGEERSWLVRFPFVVLLLLIACDCNVLCCTMVSRTLFYWYCLGLSFLLVRFFNWLRRTTPNTLT